MPNCLDKIKRSGLKCEGKDGEIPELDQNQKFKRYFLFVVSFGLVSFVS